MYFIRLIFRSVINERIGMYTYKEKHVTDIEYKESVIRIWSDNKNINKQEILQSFVPLFESGFVEPYIALMPDYHPVPPIMNGSVVPAKDVIFPSVVGCDIGCGVSAVPLPVHASSIMNQTKQLYERILQMVPVGKTHNRKVSERVAENLIWQRSLHAPVFPSRQQNMMKHQFASLGSGNHFLEIQKDQDGCVWVMLHTGSRMIGQRLQDYYLQKSEIMISPKKRNALRFLSAESELGEQYLNDVQFAVDFAKASRIEILRRVVEVFQGLFIHEHPLQNVCVEQDVIDTVHNTVSMERHWDKTLYIHRKGACAVKQEQLGIIPGSMGTKSYIVEGRGNPYSFHSCSHGAGRTMSRSAAMKKIHFKEVQKMMKNITYKNDSRLRDESPQAYKDIKQVMKSQKDLVKEIVELSPLVVVKGI